MGMPLKGSYICDASRVQLFRLKNRPRALRLAGTHVIGSTMSGKARPQRYKCVSDDTTGLY